jgi:ABC-2 type transport system ATP-binding protein
LAFVNLKGERKAKVQSFSGGMKRRLKFGIAAIGNPKIILLDEPTTGLRS